MTFPTRRRELVLLGAAVGLAAGLRLYALGSVPLGFTADEASDGYNGYSLLHTGCDRFGERLPVYTRNFGDHGEALYAYLTVPAIAVLGLTETATRLPAALAGVLTVVALFAVVRRLLGRRDALLAALLLTVSPWHMAVTRYAGSAPLLPLLFCTGLALALWRREGIAHLWLASLAFALSLYTYPAARVFVPAFLLLAAVIWRRRLWSDRRRILGPALLLLLLSLPAASHWLSAQGMARARYLLDASAWSWLAHYASYMSPGFLFLDGDPNIRHSPAGCGQLLLVEIALLPLGVAWLVRARRPEHGVLLLWLLLYPVAAALTEPRHSVRAIMGAPLMAIVSAGGIEYLCGLRHPLVRRGLVGAALVGVLACAGCFACDYFVDYPEASALRWQYGMRETFTWTRQATCDSVYVSDRLPLPHIFILFYTRFPPAEYQRAPVIVPGQGRWTYTDVTVGRYHIDSVANLLRAARPGMYVVFADEARPLRRSPAFRLDHVVCVPDGSRLIEIYEARP